MSDREDALYRKPFNKSEGFFVVRRKWKSKWNVTERRHGRVLEYCN